MEKLVLSPLGSDNDITTLRITKLIRRKLGLLIDGNETLDFGLERLLDEKIAELKQRQ